MGLIQFQVKRPDLLTSVSDLRSLDFLTYDGRVITAEIDFDGEMLNCRRQRDESGRLRIPWPRLNGEVEVVQTTSLREDAGPYQLEVELARGALSRLRNQYAAWTSSGLQTSEHLDHTVREAHRAFRTAALSSDVPEITSAAALLALSLSLEATDVLCSHYIHQRILFRRTRTPQFPVFLSCRLHSVPESLNFAEHFNAARLETPWKDIEPEDGLYHWDHLDALVNWAEEQGLPLSGGPLVNLAEDQFPDWLTSWKGDTVNLQSFSEDFIETVVGRYVGRIRHWEVVSGANRGGSGMLDEEQRMSLVARAIEAARQVDEQIQIGMRIVQPWGDYMPATVNRIPPLQFVDTLRRLGVRFSEINLEIRFVADDPAPSRRRDLLAFSQLLDHWSLLQLPLNVLLATPQSSRGESLERDIPYLRELMMMCLAKERVIGICLLDEGVDSDPDIAELLLSVRKNCRQDTA